MNQFKWIKLNAFLLWAFSMGSPTTLLAASKVDFNRDIRPVLSDNCFACHGPDTKKIKGGLRLDLRENAVKAAKSGKVALVPGKPKESEVMRRLLRSLA